MLRSYVYKIIANQSKKRHYYHTLQFKQVYES